MNSMKSQKDMTPEDETPRLEGITLPAFMLYCKAVVIKWYGSGAKTDE